VNGGEEECLWVIGAEKSEGKRLLGRPRRRWVINMIMDLVQIEWGVVDSTALAQDRVKRRVLVNAVIIR
jgi:hypothetical protein